MVQTESSPMCYHFCNSRQKHAGNVQRWKGLDRSMIIERKIAVPSSFRIIQKSAFYRCENLANVSFMTGLEVIGYAAFKFCGLRVFRLPPSLRTIETDAFRTSKVQAVELSDGLQRIGDAAFGDCRRLTNIVVPSSVSLSSTKVLEYCDKLFQGLFMPPTAPDYNAMYHAFNEGSKPIHATAHEKFNESLQNRFQGYPVHRLCYKQSYLSVTEATQSLRQIIDAEPGGIERIDILARQSFTFWPCHSSLASVSSKFSMSRVLEDS